MNLLSWDGSENLCFSKICKPGINGIPTGYHRSIHFSQSAVGFMNQCGRTIPFSSAHTSWPQLIGPKEDMWLNWASELSQSVWALTFKAPKLSVTLFSFMLTRNIMEAGVWGERTNQLCRNSPRRNWGERPWSPEFLIAAFPADSNLYPWGYLYIITTKCFFYLSLLEWGFCHLAFNVLINRQY